jgi:hypothetical protein
MDRENSEVKMEMPTRGAKMSKEARKAAVFSCEYSEQNPVYCQQCGGHEHLCRKRLNTEGLTAYFDQMATDGRVETTVQWLVEISLLIQSDVEKRLKHVHAEHSTAIRKVAQKLFERQHSLWKTHWEMAQSRGVSGMTVHACDVCEEINLLHEELAELKVTLEGK